MKLKNSPNNPQVSQATAVMLAQSGPLPVAQQFEQYEKVLPGSAERILAMAEQEQQNGVLTANPTFFPPNNINVFQR